MVWRQNVEMNDLYGDTVGESKHKFFSFLFFPLSLSFVLFFVLPILRPDPFECCGFFWRDLCTMKVVKPGFGDCISVL
jgi:hypothetical protein